MPLASVVYPGGPVGDDKMYLRVYRGRPTTSDGGCYLSAPPINLYEVFMLRQLILAKNLHGSS
jgi:hypothetical protein